MRNYCDKSKDEFLCIAESRGDEIDCDKCSMNEKQNNKENPADSLSLKNSRSQGKEIIESILKDDVCYNGHSTECLRNKLEKALEIKEKEMLDKFEELFEKKKLSLKELGLPLEDWWGESEVFSVNELEELKQKLKGDKQ